jgi:ribosomal-protein-alanine N-acetyltransferase
MPVILETERLRLRTFTIADAAFVLALLNTPSWLQYIGDRGIKTLEQAQSYLANGPIMSYATQGFGLYLVELKDSDTAIGMCGLLKRDYLEYMDIGYALLPAYEGNGYAIEIVATTMNYAFTELHLMHLTAITNTNNLRSIKILNKLGFQLKEIITIEDRELNLFIKDAQKAI